MSTVNNPTIDHNEMAGAIYFDLGGHYSVNDRFTAFVKIDNLLDRDPTASPQTNTASTSTPRSTTRSAAPIVRACATTSEGTMMDLATLAVVLAGNIVGQVVGLVA